MSIRVNCENCRAAFNAPDVAVGHSMSCPHCSSMVHIGTSERQRKTTDPLSSSPSQSTVPTRAPAAPVSDAPANSKGIALPSAQVPEGFYECDRPYGDARCSDNSCPCSDTIIPRWTGYLYISQQNVGLRRPYPLLDDARRGRNRGHSTFTWCSVRVGSLFRWCRVP